MSYDRRKFLMQLGQASVANFAGGLLPITAWAAEAIAKTRDTDFNFVLFRVIGGMDSTLGLHPWTDQTTKFADEDLWLNYDLRYETLKNIEGTQISLGAAARSIAPFAKQMAIVRGIYMGASDLGHPAAIQHISSARTQDSAPHWSSYIAEKYVSNSGFVVTNSSMQRGYLNSFPVISAGSLKQMSSVEEFSTTSGLDLYTDKTLGVQRYISLLASKPQLSKFAEVVQAQKGAGELQDESIALASMVAGLSRVAQIDMDDLEHNLDTHAGHNAHREFQRMRWDRIAAFLKGLKDNGLFEKTLVVVVTEFNRSPGKNPNDGKDHNYTDNSVALFGRDVQGGSVIGDHKIYLRAPKRPLSLWAGKFINYKTGAIAEPDALNGTENGKKKIQLPADVDLIRPADLWTTIVKSLGPELNKSLPPDGKRIPGVFKA